MAVPPRKVYQYNNNTYISFLFDGDSITIRPKTKNKGTLLYRSLFKHLTVKVSEEVSNYYQ